VAVAAACHGVLFELPGGPAPRFRCRVGPAWSPASLVEEQADADDEALWAAVRALDEKPALLERLAGNAARHGHARTVAACSGRAVTARTQPTRCAPSSTTSGTAGGRTCRTMHGDERPGGVGHVSGLPIPRRAATVERAPSGWCRSGGAMAEGAGTYEAVLVMEPDPTFETLLVHLRETRGFDFTGYKRSSPSRRVDRRMAQVGVPEILAGLQTGGVVLAPDPSVRVRNQQAHELWGLRPEEAVGRHFLTLDIGLPLKRLGPMIRRALGGEVAPQEIVLGAVNRRGRHLEVRVLGSPLTDYDDRPNEAILMMEETGRALLDGNGAGAGTAAGTAHDGAARAESVVDGSS
jgi:PAS domain-containing protein